MKELETLELYEKKMISLEEINRVEPRVIARPYVCLLEFFSFGGFMENYLSILEKIRLLDNRIGKIYMQLDRFLYVPKLTSMEGKIITSEEYYYYLKRQEAELKEKRNVLFFSLLSFVSLDELYAIYEYVAKEPADGGKIERLMFIFDLIDQKNIQEQRER